MSNTAVVDTCVLFSAALRDTLLRIAQTRLYDIRFTDEILEELRRNLIEKRNKSEQQVKWLVASITEASPDQLVQDYQHLTDLMPVNLKDRHVLAAAIKCKAQVIVTHNLKDFPPRLLNPYDITAQSPDDFLLRLCIDDNKEYIKHILVQQAESLRHPQMTISEILDRLAIQVPQFARLVREWFSLDGRSSAR